VAVHIQLRRGLADSWWDTNPLLAEGEIGIEIDTGLIKVGDGINNWRDLSYAAFSQTVDTLDSIQTDVPLSANMGRELNEKKLDQFITAIAGENISGNMAVKLIGNSATYPDPSLSEDLKNTIGISTHSALSGASIKIQTVGVMTEPSWTWTPGGDVYLSNNGVLTQTPPSGNIKIMGIAIDTTKLMIQNLNFIEIE
jgi:hypothetical protein